MFSCPILPAILPRNQFFLLHFSYYNLTLVMVNNVYYNNNSQNLMNFNWLGMY